MRGLRLFLWGGLCLGLGCRESSTTDASNVDAGEASLVDAPAPAPACEPVVQPYPVGTWESQNLLEPADCTGSPDPLAIQDQCACAERSCQEGQTCVRVSHPPDIARGTSTAYNGCFLLCTSDADCSAPAVCARNLYGLKVCATVDCRVDDDCRREPCGKCVPGQPGGQGRVWEDWSTSRCAYGGACTASSCEGCSPLFNGHLCGVE
jgi:hypothetical protein